ERSIEISAAPQGSPAMNLIPLFFRGVQAPLRQKLQNVQANDSTHCAETVFAGHSTSVRKCETHVGQSATPRTTRAIAVAEPTAVSSDSPFYLRDLRALPQAVAEILRDAGRSVFPQRV